MSLELLLLASSINFVAFSIFFDDILGQVYCFLIFTVGAAESAIGLAIVISFYRVRGSISSELIKHLKG
jgi:NADH-quinone oxidoreductase subunit K